MNLPFAALRRIRVVWSGLLACLALLPSSADAAAIDYTGRTGWVPLTQGAAFDPVATKVNNDNQAGSAGLDVVGDANHASTYMCYDAAADRLGFRVRIGDLPSNATFSQRIVIGFDLNLDGQMDVFSMFQGAMNAKGIRMAVMNPGSGANISPSTTSYGFYSSITNDTSNAVGDGLETGRLTPASLQNYSLIRVSSAVEPSTNAPLNIDIGADGKPDLFVTWSLARSWLNEGWQKVQAARGIEAGSRSTFNTNASFRVAFFTSTANTVNGDINGPGAPNSYWTNFMTASGSLNNLPSGEPTVLVTSIHTGTDAATSSYDSGVSSADFITFDPTLIFSGRGPSNGTVRLVLTNSVGVTLFNTNVSANSSGAWSFTNTAQSLPEGTYVLQAASGSAAPTLQPLTIDRTAPVCSSLIISNTLVSMTVADGLPIDGSNLPDLTRFTVVVNGTTLNANQLNSVAVTPALRLVQLQLKSTVTINPGDAVKLSYTDPAGDDTNGVVQDIAGNDLATFSLATVTNITPTVLITGITTDTGASAQDFITSDQTLTLSGIAGASAAVSVFIDGAAISTNTATSGGLWSASYAPSLAPGMHSAVARVSVGTNFIFTTNSFLIDTNGPQPLGGNTAASSGSVRRDVLSLQLSSGGESLLDDINLPDPAAFVVLVNGATTNTVIDATVDTNRNVVSLLLAAPVLPGQNISLTYSDLSSGDDTNDVIQDIAGNDAPSFTRAILNTTVAPTVQISFSDTQLRAGDTSLVTFTFSAEPVGFDAADLSATGVIISGLQRDVINPLIYTATLSPLGGTESSSNVLTVSSGWTDTDGITGMATNSTAFAVDTVAPTVAISFEQTNAAAGTALEVTFVFTEGPGASFTADDVVLTNASLTALHPGTDDRVFIATVVPGTGSALQVAVPAGAYTDGAGNPGTAGVASIAVQRAPGFIAGNLPLTIVTNEFGQFVLSGMEGDLVSLNLSNAFFDLDGDVLTFIATNLPGGLTLDPVSGIVAGMITNTASLTNGGVYDVTITAGDGHGGASTLTLIWTTMNPAPIAVNDTFNGTEDTLVTGDVSANDSDPDGDELIYTVRSAPTSGSLSLSTNGGFVFLPATNFSGVVVFWYQVSDRQGGTNEGEVALHVAAQNAAPVVMSDTVERSPEYFTKFQLRRLLTNDFDPDGTALTFVSVSSTSARGGSIYVDQGWVVYSPPSALLASENDTFQYVVTDGAAMSIGTVTLVSLALPSVPSLNLVRISENPVGTGKQVLMLGIPALRYELYATDDLAEAGWTLVTSTNADALGRIIFADLNATNSMRFYRAVGVNP